MSSPSGLHEDIIRSITRHPKEALKNEMKKRLATLIGKEESAKQITIAEAPFRNLKYNMRRTHLNHGGLKKTKGDCLLHVIGHNPGIICRNVSIEQVDNLNPIPSSPKHCGYSADKVPFLSGPGYTGNSNDDKNRFEIIEFGFAM